MQKGGLNKATKGLLLAAQNQAALTRNFRVVIMKETIRNETVVYFTSEWEKFSQGEVGKRQNLLALIIHQELCVFYKFESSKNQV